MSPPRAAAVEGEQAIAMVAVTSSEGYRGEVRAGRHRFVAGEGQEVGGDDEGPNPYQLLLAALVQCTAATLRMYANRKGWVLGVVMVRARLLRTGDGATKVERIERTIRVAGELSEDQRRQLVEIADRTPVTRTLRASVKMDTTLA
ncbi:MAG: OsmC family protein [Acidimicrobiales bacterium]